jgi:hypothetical protein
MLILGGLHERHASSTWNLGTKSAFALGPRKTMQNLDRFGFEAEAYLNNI